MAVHKSDLENFPYLRETLKIIEDMVTKIASRKFTIELPFIEMSRPEIIKLALELEVPLEKTWSYHYNLEKPCGKCNGCKERVKSFELAGVKDPLLAEV
jgi:7-cyano-7-deazaguanine synthase